MWNCNGLADYKRNDREFTNIVTDNDIIFLLESWTDKDSDVDLTGYKCYNLYRKFKHKHAKRNSGGLVLYVKDCIKRGVTIARSHHDTIIWLRLDKHYFSFDKDMYICGAYIWGDDSPANVHVDVDLFKLLQDDITHFEAIGRVLLAGDLNGRVGHRLDYISNDAFNASTDNASYTPDVPLARASMDNVHNTQGNKLLDLCKATSMRIANGRLCADKAVGSYTFFSRNGSSLIDYLLLNHNDFDRITQFAIQSFTEFSDHAPLSFTIHARRQSVPGASNGNGEHFYYRWDDTCNAEFRRGLISKLPELNTVLTNVSMHERDSVSHAVSSFVHVIRDVADPLFQRKHVVRTGIFTKSPVYDCRWFDNDCRSRKREYKSALRKFNTHRCYVNRVNLCDMKLAYKTMVRRRKYAHDIKRMRNIELLKSKKPKDFWKLFRKRKSKPGSAISSAEFLDYFKNMEHNIYTVSDETCETFNIEHDFNAGAIFEELDVPFTEADVARGLKSLKREKAYAGDCILNEYFINAGDILLSHLTHLFNIVLDTGYFPDEWSRGFIVPLYKRGSELDVNNYRGITLISCLAKLFTTVLNSRLTSWCEKNDKLSDAQYGFRKGYSTVDAIFSLHCVAQHFINNNKRLYCAFVDMRKAFDSVYINGLWYKLHTNGLGGKVLRIFRDMYMRVKSCVKHCESYSDFFECSVGLRQGEVSSPVLFALFLEDLELYLQHKDSCGLTVNDITLMLLLFADDMAILGESIEDLQHSLDSLHQYCQKWGLTVNTDKTKLMVFRKRGNTRQDEQWFYDGRQLDIVSDFNYLGTVLHYNGSFSSNQQTLAGKSLKAMNVLLQQIKKLDFTPKTLCQLFDAFVSSTANYACEVWGNTKSKEIERIHLKFCKQILGVKLSTSNAGVYGELGRYPLYIHRSIRIIKYWFKIINSNNCIMKAAYSLAHQDCIIGKTNWASSVKSLLCEHGFGNVWANPLNVSVHAFCCEFKTRLIDTFMQKWNTDVQGNSKLQLYHYFKPTFGYEAYLNTIQRKHLRHGITRLRLSSHQLRIETGRYGRNRLARAERYCTQCELRDIEDEYHFVCVCPAYNSLRSKYIPAYYRRQPSVHKFMNLLQSVNKKYVYNVAMFIFHALKLRTRLIQM